MSSAVAAYLAIVWLVAIAAAGDLGQCHFPKGENDDNSDVLRLAPLLNQTFVVTDNVKNATSYTYTIGICINVGDAADKAAVIQNTTTDEKFVAVIGRYNETSILSGSHWILLQFSGGDPYPNACNRTKRTANIMLICNHDVNDLKATRVIEENSDLTFGCYYMFEVEHCLACGEGCDSFYKRLSPGSAILISIFTITVTYLLFGFVYQRCFVKARGWDQVPNFYFWKEVGHLQADGCSFICRCGASSSERGDYEPAAGVDSRLPSMPEESPPYRSSSSHARSSMLDEQDADDRLLAA